MIGRVYTPPRIARLLVREALQGAGPDTVVLDPACGHGALLVEAFDVISALRRASGEPAPQAARNTVEHNLRGVDLDPEAVAVARSALSALAPGARPAIHEADALRSDLPAADVIVANPPYARVQRAREVATPSTRSRGAWDLYLLFIERSLAHLPPTGRMAFLTPAAWLRNDHGRGLRRLVHEGRHLHTVLDFGDAQIFEDVTTYVAITVFEAQPTECVRHARTAGGDPDVLDWSTTPWSRVAADAPWTFVPAADRALLDDLATRCDRLDRVADINVGIQTSADAIYHLGRLAPGRYRSRSGHEVPIEDGLMRPLVSGRDVRAWRASPGAWLLFPYDTRVAPRLLTAEEIATRFPLGWAWLRENEAALRARDSRRMDRDDRWWGYVYNKNLARQALPKLLVPRLVKRLRCAVDEQGALFQDNVDVGAVRPHNPADLWFLAAVLNSRVADFAWRSASRPFRGGYFAANKQFIAPVPVPRADPVTRARIADLARSGDHEGAERALTEAYGFSHEALPN